MIFSFSFFSDGGGAKKFSYPNKFFFFVDVARSTFNGSLHGHCNNLIKIFHHDVDTHKNFLSFVPDI